MSETAPVENPPVGRSRTSLVLAVVAVLAILLAGYFAWLTIFRSPAKAGPVRTTTVTNRVGGYTLQVPRGMRAKQQGKTTTLTDPDRSLSVTVTTTGLAAPRATNDAVVTAMRATYATVTLLGTRRSTVDHRPAFSTYGAVVDRQGRRTQFVLLAVRGSTKSYALSAFAPIGDATSAAVQRRFDAVARGLRIG